MHLVGEVDFKAGCRQGLHQRWYKTVGGFPLTFNPVWMTAFWTKVPEVAQGNVKNQPR